MTVSKYDVIIVGAGVGGLIVGALMAAKEGQKVLVLEKENRVGGRAIHFRGEDINTVEDYLNPLEKIAGRLVRSEPDLQIMIDRKLLHGYSFEAGWHGLLVGRMSRICHILNSLGKPLDNIAPYQGFAWWDEGKLYEVTDRGKFPWMSEADFEEMHRIAGEIYRMSTEEARSYNSITLLDWLTQRTNNQKVFDFYDITGAFLIGLNSAREVSAGEYILTTRAVARAGVSLYSGSVATATQPGLHKIAYNLAEVIAEQGGTIRLNSKAKNVVVENNSAVGVIVEGKNGDEEIRASNVVCNIPLQFALKSNLLPEDILPEEFVQKVKHLKSGGGLCPHFGLNRKVIHVPGMYMTKVYPDKSLFPDGVVLGYASNSLLDEGRAPNGKQLIEVWIGFSTEEMKMLWETGKIHMICDLSMDFMRKHHPEFDEALEWALFPMIDHVMSVAPSVDQVWENMPDQKCPNIDGLYFVGDSVRNYAQYTDGVGHGALICMNAMTGKDYLKLLPDYQR